MTCCPREGLFTEKLHLKTSVSPKQQRVVLLLYVRDFMLCKKRYSCSLFEVTIMMSEDEGDDDDDDEEKFFCLSLKSIGAVFLCG